MAENMLPTKEYSVKFFADRLCSRREENTGWSQP
jgi:hypothetical protein